MSRDLVLTVLALGVGGWAAWLAGLIPALHPSAGRIGSGNAMERFCWRRLWLPLSPAALGLAALVGWALQEPAETDELLSPLACLAILPVAIVWSRVGWRALIALRRPRVMPPAATVGILRPRVVLDAALGERLDVPAIAATLAHERAHARHRDPLRIWLARAATDAQWPSRAAERRFDGWLTALELSRDEEARRSGTAGEDLAAAVVTAATFASAAHEGHALACLTGAEAALSERVRRLLAPLSEEARPRWVRGMAAAAVLALASAVVVGVRHGDALVRALPFITG